MAFYLKRYFSDKDDVYVINDLCISFNGDFAQIDHLVIACNKIFIIESKSISGKISIDENGFWTKKFGQKEYGFASPIEQVELQSKILLKNYNRYHEKNYTKDDDSMYFRKISKENINIIIAISDDAIIENNLQTTEAQITKADLVCKLINNTISNTAVQPCTKISALSSKEVANYFLLAAEICSNAKNNIGISKEHGALYEIATRQLLELCEAINIPGGFENFFRNNVFSRWISGQNDNAFIENISNIWKTLENQDQLNFTESMCYWAAILNLNETVSNHHKTIRAKQKEMMRQIAMTRSKAIEIPEIIRKKLNPF